MLGASAPADCSVFTIGMDANINVATAGIFDSRSLFVLGERDTAGSPTTLARSLLPLAAIAPAPPLPSPMTDASPTTEASRADGAIHPHQRSVSKVRTLFQTQVDKIGKSDISMKDFVVGWRRSGNPSSSTADRLDSPSGMMPGTSQMRFVIFTCTGSGFVFQAGCDPPVTLYPAVMPAHRARILCAARARYG